MTEPRRPRPMLSKPAIGAGVGLLVVAAVFVVARPPSASDATASATEHRTKPGQAPEAPCTASASACTAPTTVVAAPNASAVAAGPRAPRLLEFEMQGCAACSTMAPIVRSIESKCAHGRDLVQRVDIQRPEGEALASRYGVRELPTFLAVDAEGGEVIRLSGVQRAERLAAVMTEITGDGCVVD